MGRDVVAKTVRDLRGAVIGWTLGLGAYAALVTASFPSIRDNAAVEAYLETLPEAMLAFFGAADLTTAAGFYRAELFSYLPALLAVFTVGKAIALTVGEERDGVLDLVLAQPIDRWRVFVGRFLGLGLATALVVTGLALTLSVGGALVGLTGREIVGLIAWCYLAGLLALLFGTAAMAVAGFVHRTRAPLLVGAVFAAGSFLLEGLARTVAFLEPIREANPYHWYALTNPVAGPVSLLGTAGLVAVLLVLLAAGTHGFERKDLAV